MQEYNKNIAGFHSIVVSNMHSGLTGSLAVLPSSLGISQYPLTDYSWSATSAIMHENN